MRSLFLIILSIFQGLSMAQNTYRLDANKSNNYGLVYSLPITVLEVTIEYEIISKEAGPFNRFAQRYLNIENPVTESQTEYKLTGITAKTVGVPDPTNKFFVEFKPNSAASFITLTEDGMICAINDSYAFNNNTDKGNETIIYMSPSISEGNKYLTQEIMMAGTSAKQAELIARQIYNLRTNRNEILAGEIDNIPTDGQAFKLFMERIDEQEAALTTLFKGEEKIVKKDKTFRIDIKSRNIDNKVIARFSKKTGPVETNNLVGAPIYMSLKSLTKEDENLQDPKIIADFEKKIARGIVYNVPGKAQLDISYDNKKYINKEIDVVQFGTKDVLEQKVFAGKSGSLKVIFYPELGAIKTTGITP